MTKNMNTAANPNEPWTNPWPADGLESIEKCPVCGEAEREILHSDLIDNVFRVAPGKWSQWKCAKCGSAYLDPRPNRETIHSAYTNYYTHQLATGKDDYATLSLVRRFRRRLANGYTNWRYSAHNSPSSGFGVITAILLPNLKRVLDRQYRHLPRLPKSGGVLLDVGCGDGSFLSLARTCGWDVIGLDPDPIAAANTAKQGLTVHEGSIEYFNGKTELFDVITLNHVIEHVHDPIHVLKTCHALLKAGGQLWLETPNIESFGHARFQKNWRGLETPRHLVLFNRRSLKQALISAGFSAPANRTGPRTNLFLKSLALELGHSPYHYMSTSQAIQWQATMASYAEAIISSRSELLTISVRKG